MKRKERLLKENYWEEFLWKYNISNLNISIHFRSFCEAIPQRLAIQGNFHLEINYRFGDRIIGLLKVLFTRCGWLVWKKKRRKLRGSQSKKRSENNRMRYFIPDDFPSNDISFFKLKHEIKNKNMGEGGGEKQFWDRFLARLVLKEE